MVVRHRYIEADETQRFKYAMFLMEMPKDFEGVEKINYKGSIIQVSEKGSQARQVNTEAYSVF